MYPVFTKSMYIVQWTCEILVSCTINAMYLALTAMVQKMKLQTKIAQKREKNVRNKFMEHFYF